ncbi:tRNA (adenosine(37)-N6)-threonylcarbamoyltransferase complex dimerization subunit type 1 TsaB [Mycoplasmopsis cricetuli]|uniref:tRNA (adenosine(37)-N6)-threonylcarbamoyltransferase complex dimerization subunit type 1 TsaB n=1 Tax=Mycoplasmopsis cricetuli TaxID=171283 RepID=UPI00046FA274|nr:tRNA (adenosine(37)-N6)-threonylcarbamoyltransferase complex dimerization subunit type 1 TsaB [Mycoplasmopsis cricetuli]
MIIFLDTTASDFIMILLDQNFKVIDSIYLQNYKKKVELITSQFDFILQKNNLQVDEIKQFYINKGPGFFTGVRSSLVFVRTIALWNQIPIYTTNSFLILQKQKTQNEYFIQANKFKKYHITNDNLIKNNYFNLKDKIAIVENNLDANLINYQDLIDNFVKYKNIFYLEETMKIEPLYISKPQIGGQ